MAEPTLASTSVARTSVRSSARRWWSLATICLAQFMLILDVTVVNVASPAIDAELRLGAALGWVIAAYSLPFGILLFAGGLLADRIGLRTSFLIGLALFTVASLAASIATSAGFLIASRAAQGAGAALLSPAALGLVISMFRGAARHRALAIWAGIGGSGSAIGSVVGGVVTQAGGWRWVFLVNVPVGIAVVILVAVIVRPSILVPSPQHDRSRGTRWAATVHALRTRAVAGGVLTMFLASVLLMGSLFVLTIALQDGRGFDPLATGLAFLPAAVAMVIGAQIGAHLLGRMSATAVGGLAFGTAAIGFAVAWAEAENIAVLIAGVAVAALGLGPALVTATALATSGVEHEESGAASGAVNTVHEVGGGIGVLLASVPVVIVATGSGSTLGFGLAAASAIIAGALVALVLPRHSLRASGGFHH